jgi:hypothetical protein
LYTGRATLNGKAFGWSAEMVATMNASADLHEALIATVRDLRDTRARQAKSEAASLWDEA